MATTSIRWAAVVRVTDLAGRSQIASGVNVAKSFPGDEQGRESIWFDSVEGEISVPTSKSMRLQRDDIFTLVWEIRTADHATVDAAMTRAYELAGIFDEICADAPTLDDLDGVLWAHPQGTQRETYVESPAGFTAYAEVSIQIHSRLT